MNKKLLLIPLFLLLLVTSVSATTLTDDIISYYSFDDDDYSGTTTYDITSNSFDLTTSGVTQGQTGIIKQAYSMDGTNDNMLYSGAIGIDNNDFTLGGWFYVEDISSQQFLIFPRADMDARLYIRDNQFKGQLYNGGEYEVFWTATDYLNTWVNLVYIYNSTDLNLYINGSLVNSTSFVGGAGAGGSYALGVGSDHTGGSNFDGLIDEVGIWDRSLSSSEVTEWYNEGRGLSYPFVSDNFSITINNVNTFNISMTNETDTLNYETTTGTIITEILVDDLNLWNITITPSGNYFERNYTNYNVSTALSTSLSAYPQITLYNIWDNSSITNFSAIINSVNYSTTDGVLELPIIGTYSYNISTNDYFNSVGSDTYLENSTHNYSMYQSEIQFTNSEIITNDLLTEVSYYINEINLSAINYLAAGTYNVTAVKSGYYNKTKEFTVTALDNTTINVSGLYNVIVNITAQEYQVNTSINTFTSNLSYLTESGYWSDYDTTTNGSILLHTLNRTDRNFTLDATSSGYADFTESYNISNAGVYNITIDFGKTESVYITWYDEDSLNLLNTSTITWELIQEGSYQNGSTTNGSQVIENLTTGDYTIRFSAPSYDERFYFFTVVADAYNVLTLYLLNSSSLTNVTMTVVDENDDDVIGAIVKALRYETSTGNYELRDQCKTGNQGTCVLKLTYNDEYYKYQVEYNDETKLTTSPEYVVSTSIVLQIYLGDEVGEEYFEWYSIDASLVFNNATNNFRLTYNDNNGVATDFCLYVYYYRYGREYLIDSSCNQLPSGTILVNTGTLQNDTLYMARAYYENNFLISATHQTDPTDTYGNFGMLLQIMLTIVFIGISVYEISLMPIAISVSIVLGRLIKLNILPWPNIWILIVISIAVTWLIRRYR